MPRGRATANKHINCDRTGKRVEDAFEHADEWAKQMWAESLQWPEGHFGMTNDDVREAKGCVAGMRYLIMHKLDWLDRVPMLIGRLRKPGIRDRVIFQCESVDLDKHDPATQRLCIPGNPLYIQLREMSPDGTGIGEELEAYINSFTDITLNDCISEGPHSKAKHWCDAIPIVS